MSKLAYSNTNTHGYNVLLQVICYFKDAEKSICYCFFFPNDYTTWSFGDKICDVISPLLRNFGEKRKQNNQTVQWKKTHDVARQFYYRII